MGARVLAIVQARLGSTRLPGKTLLDVAGRPMVAHVVERAAAIPGVDGVVLATSVNSGDDRLVRFAEAAALPWVRGSEEDVLDRFWTALQTYPADVVVRLTADCPLLDPAVSGVVVAEYLRRGDEVDYVSNVHPPTYPDGLDTEVFSGEALERAWREARLPSEREHVTAHIWRHPDRFRLANVSHAADLSGFRWTVDTAADLEFVRSVYARLSPDGTRRFGMAEILAFLRDHPELQSRNAALRRNEGLERSLAADAAAPRGEEGRTER